MSSSDNPKASLQRNSTNFAPTFGGASNIHNGKSNIKIKYFPKK